MCCKGLHWRGSVHPSWILVSHTALPTPAQPNISKCGLGVGVGGLNSRVIETVLVMSSGLPGKGAGDLQVSHLEKTGTT